MNIANFLKKIIFTLLIFYLFYTFWSFMSDYITYKKKITIMEKKKEKFLKTKKKYEQVKKKLWIKEQQS